MSTSTTIASESLPFSTILGPPAAVTTPPLRTFVASQLLAFEVTGRFDLECSSATAYNFTLERQHSGDVSYARSGASKYHPYLEYQPGAGHRRLSRCTTVQPATRGASISSLDIGNTTRDTHRDLIPIPYFLR